MKENEKQILEEVDKTLKAFDNLPELEANPFLYTRLQAKLSSKNISTEKYSLSYYKLKALALSIMLIINIFTAVYLFEDDKRDYSKEQLMYSLRMDYNSTQNDILTEF